MAEPKQYPVGIDYVFVNGALVAEKVKHTGALKGEPLTRKGMESSGIEHLGRVNKLG